MIQQFKVKYFSGWRIHSRQNDVPQTMLIIYLSYVHSLFVTRVWLFIDLYELLFRYRNTVKQSKLFVKCLNFKPVKHVDNS